MKIQIMVAGLCVLASPFASRQALAQTHQTTTQYVTIDGDVVRYEPGRVIVIRGKNNKETVYSLSSNVTVPADVRVGRRVTLFTEPGPDGTNHLVTRVTTTSVTPEGNVTRTTEDTRTTLNGEVIRYEPGRSIVVRGADHSEVVYNLNPKVVVPANVKVGQQVTIHSEPGPDGTSRLVSRVVTTSVTPEGNVARTTEETRTDASGGTTKTTTTQVVGKVTAYEPGRTLTLTRADGTQATYVINPTSNVPMDLAIGKSVALIPVTTTSTSGDVVVRTITYVPVNRPR